MGERLAVLVPVRPNPPGGTLMVDAGAMLPGDSVPSGRRQEVDGAIRYIIQEAHKASN